MQQLRFHSNFQKIYDGWFFWLKKIVSVWVTIISTKIISKLKDQIKKKPVHLKVNMVSWFENGKITQFFSNKSNRIRMTWMFFNLETGGSGTGLALPHFCACHMLGPGFPSSYVVVFFCVQWVMARHDCLFCWYWWNCWPSLFKSNYGGGDTVTDCNLCIKTTTIYISIYKFILF